ncbi:hypothetical protein IL38_23680 [Actinopolyspora erythraea]|uniref:Uncharacterized protein n=1 Tax=Actinopolyspora erythraea TaxID=414996 RepID=A0ABR4WY45_9ACTN|nr:hypothetical protein [Actinopolyspora erythraea]KGI79314.1 hypothetical protein IL38_23680 [Actinopolyspora erythraea]
MLCQHETEIPAGPDPGCAEFTAPGSIRCSADATTRFTFRDCHFEGISGEDGHTTVVYCPEHAAEFRTGLTTSDEDADAVVDLVETAVGVTR